MEKKKIDVSIIVPVYNVEKYLDKCLNSLVDQDYDKDKYEIVVINDCSNDKSIDIIKKYQNLNNNITLIDLKENKGVSNARNIGIENSHGEYIMFCDSDDYYDLKAIKKFMLNAKLLNSDFVMANYSIVKNGQILKVNSTNCYLKKNISKQEIVSFMNLTSCSKLIKRDLFIKNKVLYPTDLKRCEELTVIPVLAYLANNPVNIDEYLYYYVQRKTSASNMKVEKENVDLSFFDISFNRFKKIINQAKYSEEIEYRAIEHLLYGKSLVLLKSHVKRKDVIVVLNEFKSQYPNYLKNKYFKNFSKLKKIFIYTVNYKIIIAARIIAYIHEKITG